MHKIDISGNSCDTHTSVIPNVSNEFGNHCVEKRVSFKSKWMKFQRLNLRENHLRDFKTGARRFENCSIPLCNCNQSCRGFFCKILVCLDFFLNRTEADKKEAFFTSIWPKFEPFSNLSPLLAL